MLKDNLDKIGQVQAAANAEPQNRCHIIVWDLLLSSFRFFCDNRLCAGHQGQAAAGNNGGTDVGKQATVSSVSIAYHVSTSYAAPSCIP